uniref:SbsA Ig-like domain-containing protein n=1 Tax=Ignisphaera aggregans TaxID=334771 RepID=A0A7C4FEE3_9CREN
MGAQHSAYTVEAGGGLWNILYENADESKYTFDLNASAIGVKLVLYMSSRGDVNRDWVKICVYSEVVNTTSEGEERARYIAGYSRFGYENDGKGSADGLHVVYYLLPNVTRVVYVEVKLHSTNGSPRLDVKKSWVEPWNTTAFYWMHEGADEGYGLRYGGLVNVDGLGMEMKAAALSCGTTGYPCRSGSRFSYYYGRVFDVDSGGLADVYVDVSYVGGFNIAPESTYGKGNYVAKLDVGVATKGEQFTYFHTLYSTKKYDEPQLPELTTSEVAKGVVDIALDIASDYALEFVTSTAGKLFFKGLPYIGTVIECAEMFQSLGFDEVVASSELVVFNKQMPAVEGDNTVCVWANLVGELKSAWLSSTIMNFCGEPPWQSFMDEVFGARVWRLDQGGVYIGGILLDYYNAPEIVSALPQGDLLKATSNITVVFSKPIDEGSITPLPGSLYPQGKSIVVYLNGAEVPFYEYFKVSLSSDRRTLTIYPNYHLDYESVYRIVLTNRIRGADGTGLVKSYDLWFATEKREQKEPVVYYVVPTSTSLPNHLHYEGRVFRAQLCESIPVDLVKMQQFYVGEASFYTNDVNIDYYDGGSGRLYMVNNSLLFIPLLARDWGLPPKRGALIFRLCSEERIVQQIPAQLIISWIRVGNPTAEKSLRDVGVTEGALLDLEPVPVMEYSIPGYKIGEGVLISPREPWVNGTKLAMYLVDNITRSAHNLGALLGGYKPIYTIWLSESRPLSADIMVYIMANATYMRAWRVAPLGYTTASEEGAHAQEPPLLLVVVLTGALLSVATGLAIFLIKIRRGSCGDMDTL